MLLGTASLLLYFLFFSNQRLVTEYFTKAKWYNWEKFIESKDISYREKTELLQKAVQTQADGKLRKKFSHDRNKLLRSERFSNLPATEKTKALFLRTLGFVVSQTPDAQKNILRVIKANRPDAAAAIGPNTIWGALPYALLPVLTAFIFSFLHGGFTGGFWTFLGIEALKKSEEE